MILKGSDGKPVTLDVDIRTRGKTRPIAAPGVPPLADLDTVGSGTGCEGQNDSSSDQCKTAARNEIRAAGVLV